MIAKQQFNKENYLKVHLVILVMGEGFQDIRLTFSQEDPWALLGPILVRKI